MVVFSHPVPSSGIEALEILDDSRALEIGAIISEKQNDVMIFKFRVTLTSKGFTHLLQQLPKEQTQALEDLVTEAIPRWDHRPAFRAHSVGKTHLEILKLLSEWKKFIPEMLNVNLISKQKKTKHVSHLTFTLGHK